MITLLSNRKLLNWQTVLYWLFIGLNFLAILVYILVLMLNVHSISFRYLDIIGAAGRFYSKYVFSSHQLLTYFSIVLLLVMMFRMNKNLRYFNGSRSSNRFLIAIHWILPVFSALFRYSFFRKYHSQWNLESEKKSKRFKLLNVLLMICGVLASICVYSQITLVMFFHREFGPVVEIALGIGASFWLLLCSVFYLRFLRLLKELDSSYHELSDKILEGPIDQLR